MFHVEDDFDFDDDTLDCSVSGNNNSQEGSNITRSAETSFLQSPSSSHSQIVNNSQETEFLNIWNDQSGNGLEKKSKNSFPYQSKPQVSTRYVKTYRQRRFPGPAGLLPERQGNTSLIATEEFLNELNSELDDSSHFEGKEILSQSSGRLFESGAWSVMMDDLGSSGRALVTQMNLTSLRLKHVKGYKVPFLAVIINNIDCTLPDPTVVFKDVTGEMNGMLHRDVWEKFNTDMFPGSVLVLKNVGVISAGTTSRRHVLNITTNNLIAIYSNRQEGQVQVRKISDMPTGDNSRMLNEWEKIVSTPPSSETLLKKKPLLNKTFAGLNHSGSTHMDSPVSSHPTGRNTVKPSFNRRTLFNNQCAITNTETSTATERFVKRPKNGVPIADNETTCGKSKIQKQTTSLELRKKPFQVDSDTSVVDSLLDGIDTNSLFDDF